jgi:hypothetical protein
MENDTINITRPQKDTTVNVPEAVKLASRPQNNKSAEKPKYPSEPIGLPSEGYFYNSNSPLSNGLVDIKYMTAKEEDILTSQNLIKKGVVLEKLLESLIVTDGVKIDELLIGDKNALFIASRRLAYGDSYGPLEVKCPKCGKENRCTVDLSKVNNKEFDFEKYERGTNLFEFVLPASKVTIKYKLLTHRDETSIDQELTALNKINKSGASSEITTRLKKMIVSIDGNEDRQTINKFVDQQLLSKDSLAFRSYVKENTPDIDLSFDFECEDCQHNERMGIPLSVSFFWPDTRV